jgi:hypothetical protein
MDRRPQAHRPDRRRLVRCLLPVALGVVSAIACPGPNTVDARAQRPSGLLDAARVSEDVCTPGWLRAAYATNIGTPRPTSVAVMTGVLGASSQVAPAPAVATAARVTADLAQDPAARYPNDPLFRFYQRRSLMLIGALDAWDTSRGGADVTVAIISTGVQTDHPDLATKIWRNPGEVAGNGIDDDANGYVDDIHGWNFPAGTNDPTDIPKGRGTMMAGIVGAATNNDEGIAGVSWGARIMPLKTLVLQEDAQGKRAVGTLRDIVAAVCYAANNGAKVIVFGGSLRDPDNAADDVQRLQQAVRYAYYNAGAVLVAPAGDCGMAADYCPPAEYGDNPPIFPAAFDKEVIGVQSFGLDYRQRDEASGGYWVDISAPGEGFDSTIFWDPPYAEIHPQPATSDFAAAHIAGVLAVMRSVNPNTSAHQLEDLLCQTADRPRGVAFEDVDGVPHNDRWGCGYVDFDNVLDTMEPKLRITPDTLRQFTDGTTPWPRLIFDNPYLRASRWMVTPEDALWITPESVEDGVDGVARAYLRADLDRLVGERGVALQAGGPPITARLKACPLGTHADNPALCQELTYELTFVDHVWRLSLPRIERD